MCKGDMNHHEPKNSKNHKKQDTKLLPITLPNNDRFSKFFHYYTQQEIYNKDNVKCCKIR